ncbi:MAG TPA: FecR domain-containing protein [Candidatus Acidoferrales bacterium]|nr:FecR domain-containing protein [Candidatus Acidoferrales bacterium]
MLFRPLLAGIVSATLVALPSLAAPQNVAVAGPSKSAIVRGGQLTQGTNVFNGDTVEVAQGGDSTLMLGQNASVHLGENSAVRFFRCGDTSTVQLLRGVMSFRSTPQRPVQVQLGDATIQPTAGQTVIGQVALTSPTTANLSAQQGSFTVTAAHEGKSALVNQGESRVATLTTPANQASPNPPLCGVAAAVPSHPVTTAWVMIGTAAAGLAIGLGLSSHQSSLTCPQKAQLVSPYTFPCQ